MRSASARTDTSPTIKLPQGDHKVPLAAGVVHSGRSVASASSISVAVSRKPSTAISLSTSKAPSTANRRAIPRPIPEPAPVISAILFARRIHNFLIHRRTIPKDLSLSIIALHFICVRASALRVEHYKAQFGHLFDGIMWPFTTHTAMLHTTIRHLARTIERSIVDHYSTDMKAACGFHSYGNRACEDASLQAKFGIVGNSQSLFNCLVGLHDNNRGKGFLAYDTHLLLHIRQYSGAKECTISLPTCE